jgi:DMSO/TMAO reductase YedYZ heme-binding membrane subunit
VSKVVNWGHWLVSAAFVALGADAIWSALTAIPRNLREHPQDITYRFASSALFCALVVSCAWGILKWRVWGHALALTVCILVVLFDLLFLIAYRDFELSFSRFAGIAAPILIAAWLLLPSVRAAYRQRERLA